MHAPRACLEKPGVERSSNDTAKPSSRSASEPQTRRTRRWSASFPEAKRFLPSSPFSWPRFAFCFPKAQTQSTGTNHPGRSSSCKPGNRSVQSSGGAPPSTASPVSIRPAENPLPLPGPAAPAANLSLHSGNMTVQGSTATRLSGWDQVAMRGYMSIALCFPFNNAKVDAAAEHIEASLARLALQRPDFAGTLEVRDGGIVHHRACTDNKIPFVVEDISSEFPYASYADLKAAEFPPAAFVHPRFLKPCPLTEGRPGVPVSTVKAFVIPGGLLLAIYFCHSFADGDCLRIFIETFSGQTRGTPVERDSTKNLVAPFANESNVQDDDDGEHLHALLKRVPEYVVLDTPTGPTAPKFRAGGVPMEDIEKIGKVFVFDNARLRELRSSVQSACTAAASNGTAQAGKNGDCSEHAAPVRSLPSNYICLAALTWAHIARARLADPTQYMPYDQGTDDLALLQTMVNWKSRALKEANPSYFGNATAIAVTQLPTRDGTLTRASDSQCALATLVLAIEKTISGVNDDSIRDRTELFSRVSDPRLVGLRFDPRTPQDLGFNTWRFFGVDTQWAIPGVHGGASAAVQPDVIRRLQGMWNMSGALILPAKADSTTHELLVTLPKSSMDLLCHDAGWMKWVDHVVG